MSLPVVVDVAVIVGDLTALLLLLLLIIVVRCLVVALLALAVVVDSKKESTPSNSSRRNNDTSSESPQCLRMSRPAVCTCKQSTRNDGGVAVPELQDYRTQKPKKPHGFPHMVLLP